MSLNKTFLFLSLTTELDPLPSMLTLRKLLELLDGPAPRPYTGMPVSDLVVGVPEPSVGVGTEIVQPPSPPGPLPSSMVNDSSCFNF